MPRSLSTTTRHEIPVVTPYRLDLTVSALRRLSSNLVDIYTADGRYLRALGGFAEPVVLCVTQPRVDTLSVAIGGNAGDEGALATVRRMLGTERDLTDFDHHAQQMPWLASLARRMHGIKPPRYPTLWEACVNAVVFQQLSLHSATAIMRRLLLALSDSTTYAGVPLVIFPSAERFLGAHDGALRAAGLSAGKVATLRRAGEATIAGALNEAMLEERSSVDAATLLRGIKGIGRWTAALILLRGLGRLDTFPSSDSSVAANLALVAGERLDVEPIAEALGAQRGMLYFYLLLARLELRDEIGRVSDAAR